uniref:Reverse transcriptase domain-containing protein n=1 Tax=Tanacetum cinerariifolium TaxID=118510 RepID=A0A6L2L874_TANCI|nr:reverse transcriptase domain-containing protein [Tanacetum cinerariifolium]
MEELCQASLNGWSGPIAPIDIQEMNFGLKNDMIQQSIKVNGVTEDALCLYLFPHSLTHHATAWFDRLPRNSINTFEQMAKMFLEKYFPPSMVTKLRNKIPNFHQRGTFLKRRPEECYDLIENMTAHHNDWDTSAQRIILNCETCGDTYSFFDCPAIVGNTQNVYAAGAYQGSRTLPGNTITNPKEDLKGITTRRGTAYPGPMIPTTSSSTVVEFNSLIIEPVASPVSASRPNQRPSILYPSRLHDQKLQKLGDPGKFLIPCDFPRMAECLALADLCASINLMPLSVWNKLYLLDFSPTCMTLELVDRSISCLVGIAEDVFVKVGTFHFPDDFVIVDFNDDPRVPLILERSFLKTKRSLIDVFEGELTLRVGKEAITFNLDQTSRYSANYNDMTAKRIDVIDMACEEYSHEVLEVDAFLALEDDPTSPEVDRSYLDSKGDILLLEAFLNDDPSLPPLNQGNYLPEVRKELKICEAKSNKSSIDEPLEVEHKDLPPHLEYAFLEGDDKLPVIIAKDLSMEEKTAHITVLKSHKRAIAWKLSDIKGIDPEFCTHKILMEEDFEPVVQHQRRVNPKIYDVIKNEVLKLLDAGLIYPIFDSPWVSPIHYVPKKGGFIVVENEENELISTYLVTGWRACIDYRKLNEATHKDHFPLHFMDQMLERLEGNQYYYFLDGFSGYFQIPIDLKD